MCCWVLLKRQECMNACCLSANNEVMYTIFKNAKERSFANRGLSSGKLPFPSASRLLRS